MKKILIVSLVIVLSGCERTPDVVSANNGQNYGLTYSVDKERNIICYRFVSREGISCLKLDVKGKE